MNGRELSEIGVNLLTALGYHEREGELAETPRRFAEFWKEWHADGDPPELVLFDGPEGAQIEIGPFPFHAMCPHHLLPYFGTATIKYVSGPKVIGLSKIPRLVEWHARRLIKQEDLTAEIAGALAPHAPGGVEVVTEAEHLCLSMRGVQKPGTKTRVTVVRGGA